MSTPQSAVARPARPTEDPQPREAFNGGKLWFGEHSADKDVLVFDPEETDPYSDRLSLYSLTQHRMRTFTRTVVQQLIHVLPDVGRARAKKDYGRRAALRSKHEDTMEAAKAEALEGQRQRIVEAHRRYLEALGLPYQGSRKTASDHRPGRRVKCHACGIALDDFAGSVCVACDGVLCSCGGCACGGKRPTTAKRVAEVEEA